MALGLNRWISRNCTIRELWVICSCNSAAENCSPVLKKIDSKSEICFCCLQYHYYSPHGKDPHQSITNHENDSKNKENAPKTEGLMNSGIDITPCYSYRICLNTTPLLNTTHPVKAWVKLFQNDQILVKTVSFNL